MRIVYMGTPDFAVNPLNSLIENGYGIFPEKFSLEAYKLALKSGDIIVAYRNKWFCICITSNLYFFKRVIRCST